ncbi:Lamin tail domain-containing protein 1 [Bulinus truncatus]|nr:Lamin tail domain-containing protein 1 [Bulinus truncatus]
MVLSNLEHQKETLENVLLAERSQAAFNIIQLEKRFRNVQNQLVIQMREVSNAREAKLPLRAEIETLKMLLEEEEQRLNVPLAAMPNSVVQSPLKHSTSTSTTQSPQLMHALLSAISDEQQVSNLPQSFADARKANVLQLSTVPSQNLSSAINTENLISSYGPANSSYLGEPSSVVKTISSHEGLQSGEEKNRNDIRFDQNAQEFSLPITRPNYHYESTPSISRVLVEADKKQISKPIGPIPSRIKSAPVSFERNLQETEDWKKLLKTNKLSQEDFKTSDEDAFKKLFVDFKQETLFPKQRPKSTPPGRSLSSTLEDYNVTTSNSLRDLKIAEVSQDGKYVRLLNDGTTDVEIGGFIIQQNVGGHPVAAFRFPSQTKFQADSTITIWAGINDSQIHYPPHEFYWKELYKWRAGPETTTILCQPNGQAVAWYTAAHRVSKDAYIDTDKSSTNNKSTDKKDIKKDVEEEILTELNKDLANIKSEPIF